MSKASAHLINVSENILNLLLVLEKYKSDGYTIGAATPGFNSLIPAPSVRPLVRIEPVELLGRASNISTTDPFCFVKQK